MPTYRLMTRKSLRIDCTRPMLICPSHWRRCQLLIALAAGVAAMIEKLVRGFVVVALMIMVILSYAQKHEGCLRGRSLETFQPPAYSREPGLCPSAPCGLRSGVVLW